MLSAEARETLLIVSVLLPMSVSNLRAQVNSRLAASDASNWGEAGVVSSLPSKIGEERWQKVIGAWTFRARWQKELNHTKVTLCGRFWQKE